MTDLNLEILQLRVRNAERRVHRAEASNMFEKKQAETELIEAKSAYESYLLQQGAKSNG